MSMHTPGMLLHVNVIHSVYDDPSLSRLLTWLVESDGPVLVLSSGNINPSPSAAAWRGAPARTLTCVLLPTGVAGWLLEKNPTEA